jgi:hypothetical protein
MKLLLLPVFVVFFSVIVAAQQNKTYPVKVGESPNKILPNEAQYVLAAFKQGTVKLRNGGSSTQQFNYNFLLDEIQFITPAGDTLAIADPVLVRTVVIDSFVFYYDKGYLREISKSSNYVLAVKQSMVQIADKTRGGYDAASGASSITTYGSINNNSQIYRLQVKKDVLFQERRDYYISDVFNHFVKAEKKEFLSLFAAHKPAITKYIKEQKINFNKETDLKKLLQFCAKQQ